MYKFCVVLITCLLSGFAFSDPTSDTPRINWYHADFPPGFISSGPLRGQGYENYLETLLRQDLNDYQHDYVQANYGRILQQIRKGQTCCVALRKTKEREAYIVYSQPTMAALANGAFVLSEKLDQFKPFMDESGYLSLTSLTGKTSLIMGVARGRSYGTRVDELIRQLPAEKLYIRSGEDVFAGLLRMAYQHQSIDYLLGYPHELVWLQHQLKLQHEFTFLPIQELPPYTLSYVGCSKGEWGEKVVKRINAVLNRGHDPEYKRRYQAFLPDEAIPIHNKLVEQLFTEPSTTTDPPD